MLTADLVAGLHQRLDLVLADLVRQTVGAQQQPDAGHDGLDDGVDVEGGPNANSSREDAAVWIVTRLGSAELTWRWCAPQPHDVARPADVAEVTAWLCRAAPACQSHRIADALICAVPFVIRGRRPRIPSSTVTDRRRAPRAA